MLEDRRRSPRVATDLVGTVGGADDVSFRVLNISKTGALAIASHELPEMSMVCIELNVKQENGNEEAFACEAAIVRCDRRPDGQYDMGLYFTSVSEASRKTLERLIAVGTLISTN